MIQAGVKLGSNHPDTAMSRCRGRDKPTEKSSYQLLLNRYTRSNRTGFNPAASRCLAEHATDSADRLWIGFHAKPGDLGRCGWADVADMPETFTQMRI